MEQQNKTDSKAQTSDDRNRNPFTTTKAVIKNLPIGLRNIFIVGLLAWAILIAVSIFHPSLNERIKFFTDMTLNLVIGVVVAVQAYVYTKQRDVMERQWRAMQDQLEVMRNTLRHSHRVYEANWNIALQEMDMTREQLVAMQEQTIAMQEQSKTQIGALEETRKMVEQNERTITASEKSIETARRQIEFMARSESAYLGVDDLVIPPLRNNQLVVNGKIFNRGKTPAFDFQRQIQIAIGAGLPPIGWGRFEWSFNPEECESLLLVAGASVNFTTPPLRIDPAMLTEINEGRQTIVIDGQCRYRDNVGDLLIYRFGITVEIDPPHGNIRYQDHERQDGN